MLIDASLWSQMHHAYPCSMNIFKVSLHFIKGQYLIFTHKNNPIGRANAVEREENHGHFGIYWHIYLA